ncbi:rhomboid family intramembrane serine protease GlpG [Neptunicella sp. SCSIO 80796]|uniref:rhomboid family intramembrane serine protease GlpG n=1 Tax=Neptunicella plasticusilytica TaxID=3117012 RepID=UPI003A4E0C28
MLINFGHESHARLLCNYLQSEGLSVAYRYQAGEYPHGIILLDASQQDKANRLIQAFLNNPQDKKYQQSAWQSGAAVKMRTQVDLSPQRAIQFCRQAPFTSIILALCSLFYITASLGWFMQVNNFLAFQPIPILIETHQWWRLFSPTLLHFSILHIVFNLLWWGMLGQKIEQRFGSLALFILYFFSGIISNYGQFLASGIHFGGLSGVVYAVLGFVWWIGWLRPDWKLGLPNSIVGFMLVWLVIGYADVLWVSMANTAHTLGLICGCAMAWLVSLLKTRPRTEPQKKS